VFEIEDFSSNGTYLNGKRLQKNKKSVLKNDDLIGIVVKMNEKQKGKAAEQEMWIGFQFRDAH